MNCNIESQRIVIWIAIIRIEIWIAIITEIQKFQLTFSNLYWEYLSIPRRQNSWMFVLIFVLIMRILDQHSHTGFSHVFNCLLSGSYNTILITWQNSGRILSAKNWRQNFKRFDWSHSKLFQGRIFKMLITCHQKEKKNGEKTRKRD